MGQHVQCVVVVELDETVQASKSLKRLTAALRERLARIAPRAVIRVAVNTEGEEALDLQPPHRGTLAVMDSAIRRLVDDREAWCVPASGAKPVVEEDEAVLEDEELLDVG